MRHQDVQDVPDGMDLPNRDLDGYEEIAEELIANGCAIQRTRPTLTVYVPDAYEEADRKALLNDLIHADYVVTRIDPLDAGPFQLKLEILHIHSSAYEP